jgi:F-type H+-transporting ATPase subunit alpha
VEKVKEFEVEFLEHLEAKHKDVLAKLAKGQLDESISEILEKTAKEICSRFVIK